MSCFIIIDTFGSHKGHTNTHTHRALSGMWGTAGMLIEFDPLLCWAHNLLTASVLHTELEYRELHQVHWLEHTLTVTHSLSLTHMHTFKCGEVRDTKREQQKERCGDAYAHLRTQTCPHTHSSGRWHCDNGLCQMLFQSLLCPRELTFSCPPASTVTTNQVRVSSAYTDGN